MKRISYLGLITVYGVFLSLFSFHLAGAFFTDSANSTTNTFTAADQFPSVVISEIQTATTSATTSDFIELYNTTTSDINLDGYRLVKRTAAATSDTSVKAFDSSDIIQAHGFYLWASSDAGYADQIGGDVSTAENIADDNSIALRNGELDAGVIIDAVGWGTLTGAPLTEGSPLANIPDGQSLERKALSNSDATSMGSGGVDEIKGNGFDAGNNATDFILRTTSQPQNSGNAAEMP